ncbi:MAG: hypothetical protein WC901_05490 [Candidatus Margulisiibacteriota bacterium]
MPVVDRCTSSDMTVAARILRRPPAATHLPVSSRNVPPFLKSFSRVHPKYNIWEAAFTSWGQYHSVTARIAARAVMLTRAEVDKRPFSAGGVLSWSGEIVEIYNATISQARLQGKSVEWANEEIEFLNLLTKEGFLAKNTQGFFEVTGEDVSIAFFLEHAPLGIKKHELNHGLFSEEPGFRHDVTSYWENALTSTERQHIRDFLLKRGNPEILILAEFAAHAHFTFYNREALFGSIARADEIRQAILVLEAKYWEDLRPTASARENPRLPIRLTALDPNMAASPEALDAEQLAAVHQLLGIRPVEE